MPEESKEEELEFLKREEIRTMQKDIAKLWEIEAQKERERIAALKPEEMKKERLPFLAKAKKEISPPTDLIPKPHLKKIVPLRKTLIRVALSISLLFGIGLFFWFTMRKPPIEEVLPPPPEEKIIPEEEVVEVEEEIIEKPEILIPASLILPEATETIEVASRQEIPIQLPHLLERTFEKEGHIRILFENTVENKIVGLREFFEAFETKIPDGLLEKLNDDFTLFIYSGAKDNRLGFIAKIEENEDFVNLVHPWEATMEKDTEELFEVLGREKTETQLSFRETIYKNTPLRYISFPYHDNFGTCWAIYEDKFIFTSSGESIIKTIDKLLLQ